MTGSGATSELAHFAATTRWSDIPDDVLEKARLHLADVLAAMHAGRSRTWVNAARSYANEESAPGRSHVVGQVQKLRPSSAAFVNATAAHGLELDDYHVPAAVHPGCVVVPAALAVGEEIGASTREILAAIVIGYETVIRFGLAMSPEMTQDRGFHVTSAIGPFGAAAAGVSLLGLTGDMAHAALGLAAAESGGTTEFTRSGGEVKRAHAGLASSGGLRAAALAQLGLTAPTRAIEGERGFATAFGGRRVDLHRLTSDLGSSWNLHGLGIKAWSTCTGNHPAIAAAEKLVASGTAVDRIRRIDVFTDRTTAAHCGHVGPRPLDMTGAQFSLHVSVGMRLALGGNDLTHYEQLEALGFDAPAVTGLAEKVRIHVGDEQEQAFSSSPSARLVVELEDGSSVSAEAVAAGAPADPFGWDGVSAKCHGTLDGRVSHDDIDGLVDLAKGWGRVERPVLELLSTAFPTTDTASEDAA